MFRHDLTAVSLLDAPKAARRRPSFQPALEALEERQVLNGMGGMPATPPAPTAVIDPQAIVTVNQLTSLVQSFTGTLDRKLHHFAGKGGTHRELDKLFRLANNFERLEKLAGDVVTQVELTHSPSEPFLAQATAEFHQAVGRYNQEIGRVTTLAAVHDLMFELADMAQGRV